MYYEEKMIQERNLSTLDATAGSKEEVAEIVTSFARQKLLI